MKMAPNSINKKIINAFSIGNKYLLGFEKSGNDIKPRIRLLIK